MHRLVSLVMVAAFALVADARAATVMQTATLGPTGSTSGSWGIFIDQYYGVRFELTTPVTTTAIGGHFQSFYTTPRLFFGAIVKLTSMTDFPDSANLSTADVLGGASLTWPHPSAEVSAPLAVNMGPGFYALIFGSGGFGSTGHSGNAVNNGNVIGTPSWIVMSSNGWHNTNPTNALNGARFFIHGVPEPSTLALAVVGLVGVAAWRLRRKR